MTTTATKLQMMANVLGALCAGSLTACERADQSATEVPGGTSAGATDTPTAKCLHSEGCCGGHTEGDGSCGASKAEAPSSEPGSEAGTKDALEPQRFEWTVEPGGFAEINLELGAGTDVVATFDADERLAWNVHSHEGDKATIHAEGSDAAGAPAFATEKDGLFSYLWANKGKRAVKLTVELRFRGTGRVHSTHPKSP